MGGTAVCAKAQSAMRECVLLSVPKKKEITGDWV